MVIAFYSDIDNKYHILNYGKNELIYDNMENYYKDFNINTKDKKTFIRIFKVCKDRTEEDVFNNG